MRIKLKKEVERENITKKTSLVLIRISGYSTFPTLCQKLLFSLGLFSVILKPFIFKFSLSEN